MAEATAKAILLSYPMVSQVDLTIKKPWAPIGLPLDTVSVEISRGWHTAYIALGSNMGDKEKYLNEAVEKLQQTSDCQVLKVSDFLVTAPYGGVEQDDFLNGALALKTLLTPQELLERLHEIEQEAHRERLIHWGPRTLDLDILLYDDLVLDTPGSDHSTCGDASAGLRPDPADTDCSVETPPDTGTYRFTDAGRSAGEAGILICYTDSSFL